MATIPRILSAIATTAVGTSFVAMSTLANAQQGRKIAAMVARDALAQDVDHTCIASFTYG